MPGREVVGRPVRLQQGPARQPAHGPLLVGGDPEPVEQHVELRAPDPGRGVLGEARPGPPRPVGAQPGVGLADPVRPVGEPGLRRARPEPLPQGFGAPGQTGALGGVHGVDPGVHGGAGQQGRLRDPAPARGVPAQPARRRPAVHAERVRRRVGQVGRAGQPGRVRALAGEVPQGVQHDPGGVREDLLGDGQRARAAVAVGLGDVRHGADLPVAGRPRSGHRGHLPGRAGQVPREGRGGPLAQAAHPDPYVGAVLPVPDEEPPGGVPRGDEAVEERGRGPDQEGVGVGRPGVQEEVVAVPGVGGRHVRSSGVRGRGGDGPRGPRGAAGAGCGPAGTAPPAAGAGPGYGG